MTATRSRWVVLDVGETIIDESRIWRAWADAFRIPHTTFMSVFGSIVERGLNYQHIAEYFPRVDWQRQREAVESVVGGFQADDLYPDALPALTALRERGYRTAVIANQPAERAAQLRALGVEPEVMAMSDEMGASKPDPTFFSLALTLLGDPDPRDVAYVGDRIDNDVLPSSTAGMRAVWLRRGPWGVIPREAPPQASLVVESLAEMTARIHDAWR
jgi:HAD superfamily hydrolase (TIGR01549 family)